VSTKKPIKPTPAPKPRPEVGNKSAFGNWETYLEKNQLKLLLILPLVLGTLFAALNFDVKISEGNDDAMYIEAATKYAANFTGYYYTSNAPMYPMMLGLVTMISGFNLTLFKLISTLLFLTHLALMYFAFHRRVPYVVLFPVLIFSAVNSYFLYYASQTYTEMLFVTLQAVFFLMFFRWQEKGWQSAVHETSNWKALYNTVVPPVREPDMSAIPRLQSALAIGLILFLMTFCKNIAIGMLGAVMVFFVIQRNWKSLGDALGGFIIIRLSFEGLKAAVWGASNQYGSQGAILLQKDAYNAAAGQEDLNGFITRFFENFKLYNGKRLYQILGFKDPDSNEAHGILAFLALVVLIFAAWRIVVELKKSKNNHNTVSKENKLPPSHPKNILLVLIYIVTMLGLTFIVLQTRWDQARLIMVYVPLFLMTVFYGFYSYFNNSGAGGRIGYVAIATLIVGSSFLTILQKSVANYPVLKKNLQGDMYYGYTPDWENFLRLSAWCADSLPKGSYVASRKAPMSFVYAKGMPFYPVYSVPAVDSTTNLSNPDTVLAMFKENKVTHVLLGSLRRNPTKPDGYIVNTLHRMMQPIAQKYPEKIILIKQIGTTEPAYLYEIKN